MKKKRKIILIVMFLILLFIVLAMVEYFYLNKEENIKKYFGIQVPSGCEFISYKKTGEELKAVVKVSELEMTKVLEDVKKHYCKADDAGITKEVCYARLEREFGIEKEKMIEMYESWTSRKRWYATIKTVDMDIFFVKGDEEEYYICFDTEIWFYG